MKTANEEYEDTMAARSIEHPDHWHLNFWETGTDQATEPHYFILA